MLVQVLVRVRVPCHRLLEPRSSLSSDVPCHLCHLHQPKSPVRTHCWALGWQWTERLSLEPG